MNEINLIYFNRCNNFGDELSPFIIASLVDKNKYKLILNQKNKNKNIIGIGSYIHSAVNNSFIYGSGIRTNPSIERNSHKYNNLNVCAVRGPLTKKILENKKIYVPNIFGDPALLLSKFYTPIIISNLNNKIGIIPHYSNYKEYLNLDKDVYCLINPTDKWENVINNLYSCKYIISSSLHGLICSDAYSKPNIWLDEFPLAEGDFKFKDYFLSQGRSYIKINNLNEFKEENLYKDGNKIDLDKLINAFPFR